MTGELSRSQKLSAVLSAVFGGCPTELVGQPDEVEKLIRVVACRVCTRL